MATRRRARLVRRMAAVSIMLALVAGACGGGSEQASGGTGGGNGSSAGSKDADKAFLAYARCMREHGVNMPDPDPSQGVLINLNDPSIDRDALAKAESECGKHLEGITVDNPDGLTDTEMQDRMVKLTQCLRERGFNIPDPQPVGRGAGGPPQGAPDFDFNDAEFKRAERECAKAAGVPEPQRESGRRPS